MKSLILLFTFLSSFTIAHAGKPAGIVLYHKSGDEIYLLLADDHKQERGWSAFGGGADFNEAPLDTACRETEEETRGFYKRDWLKKQIADSKPFTSFGYHMYFVEVPFTPALRIQNNPLPKNAGKSAKEKTHFAWIPLTDFISSTSKEKRIYPINPLYLPKSSKVTNYWSVWVKNMQEAQRLKALPWSKK